MIVAGCAKFPASGGTAGDTRLVFRMTIAGALRADYVYIVALRVSTELNPTTTGPIPVVIAPSANGFVTGNATHFVRWDSTQSRPYILYRFDDASDLVAYREVAIPINSLDTTVGGKTLGFELSTLQLAADATSAAALQSVQANFLTMNRLALQTSSGRIFDSLGDNRSASDQTQFVRVPLGTSGIYDNARFNLLEPPSDSPGTTDVADPDLDLVDWSIEVRRA